MLGHVIYNAYYGRWDEYNSGRATLFFASNGGNLSSVKVINSPVLEWEINKAGNITFILDPENDGYEKIKCKKDHVFIERNKQLIWHGRAIQDSFDELGNREILCEGALNYLLDTHVKPYNSFHEDHDTDIFNELIDEHNRSLQGGDSVIFGTDEWFKYETNGTIKATNSEIKFVTTGTTGWNLFILSAPSIWQYKNYTKHKIRVSFNISILSDSNTDFVKYGLHLRDTPYAEYSTNRHTIIEGPELRTSQSVDTYFTVGPGGLDGTGHEDSYIGFHIYVNSGPGTTVFVHDLKVEFTVIEALTDQKAFPVNKGLRTGINRIPFSNEKIRFIDGTEFPTTLDAINNIFVEPYGGYLFVNYDWDQENLKYTPYLNYIYGNEKKDFVGDTLPEISYGKNLISCKITKNYENTPTVIIPLGREKYLWEYAQPVTGVAYYPNNILDKDGKLFGGQSAENTLAIISVKAGDTYLISGQGVDGQCLYSITNASGEIIYHTEFNAEDSLWYNNVEIEIPDGGRKLRVFFYNARQVTPIDESVFSLTKVVESDTEKYLTLENYTGTRTDALSGTLYYPVKDFLDILTNGWVEQVVHFENADTVEDLLYYAARYCSEIEEDSTMYEIEAADLEPIVDESEYMPIGMPGSYAKVTIPGLDISKKLCVTKCSLDLRDFSKTRYSLANLPPPDLGDLLAKGMY